MHKQAISAFIQGRNCIFAANILNNTMKRLITILALLPFVSSFGAENIFCGDTIPVVVVKKKNIPTPKSPEQVPFQVFIDTEEMLLTASTSATGAVDVQIEDITTGVSIQDSFITNYSTCLPASGYYRITFTLADGSEYFGYFTI